MQNGHDVDPREENPRTPYWPRPKKQLRYHDHVFSYMFIIITFTLSESSRQTQTPKGMERPKMEISFIQQVRNSEPFVVKFMKGSFAGRSGAPIHHTFPPEVADVFPYTFSKIRSLRGYQSRSKYGNSRVGGLIQGQIYNLVGR